MKLSHVNNVLIFIVLIILSKLAYNIFMNKKNIESFINRWSLNSHGQLCHNNGNCKNIAVLDTNSNRICSIENDTLNCNDITTTPPTPPSLPPSPSTPSSLPPSPSSPSTPPIPSSPSTPSTPSTPVTPTPSTPSTPASNVCPDSTAGILTITHDGVVKSNGSITGFQVVNMNITYSDELIQSIQSGMMLQPADPSDDYVGTYLGFNFQNSEFNLSELFTINELDTSQIIISGDNAGTYNVSKNEDNCYIITQV